MKRLVAPGFVVFSLAVLWLRFNAPPGDLPVLARRMATQGDLLGYYVPMFQLVASRLASGELPLWNPHACSGIPLLATLQVGAFYPGNWLTLLLPVERAIPLLMWLECGLAGLFSMWLFRALGYGAAPSALAGVLYIFGCMLGQVLWPPVVSTLLWLPWLLLAVDRLAAGVRARWWLGLALGVALQLFAGFPQYAAYGLLLVAPFGLLRIWEERRAGAPASELVLRVVSIAVAFVIGLGLASAQLIPTLELSGQSVREAPLDATMLHYLTIWNPYSSSEVLRAAIDSAPSYIGFHLGADGGYLGVATSLLALIAVVAGWREPRVWLWVAVGAVALLLSGGLLGAEPLYTLFAKLPVVGAFRTPERLRLVWLFCMLALAVIGLDLLRRQPGRRLQGIALCLAFLLAVGMFVSGSEGGGLWRLAGALATIATIAWAGATKLQRGSAEAALLVVLLLDLALATEPSGSLRELPMELSRRYSDPKRAVSLPAGLFESQREQSGFGRIVLAKHRPRIASSPSQGGYRLACYEPLVPAQWPLLEKRLRDRDGMGATLYDLDSDQQPDLLDLAGVVRELRWKPNGQPEVVANADAMPRVWLVSEYDFATQEEAFDRLATGRLDFRREVLLPPGTAFETEGLVAGARKAPSSGSPGTARITSYEPERVVVAVESRAEALMVLSDTWFPGWHASVDGEAAPVLHANGLYRAVRVGPGPHQVVFEYAPESLATGGALSAVSGVLAVGLSVAIRWRTREGPTRDGRRGV